MRTSMAMAVVLASGVIVTGCAQGGARPMAYGSVAAMEAEPLNNPDLAPVGGRDPAESPATTPGGTGTLGDYGGAGEQN